MADQLTDREWNAVLDNFSCDYCEPEKSGLREEINALIAARLAEERTATDRLVQKVRDLAHHGAETFTAIDQGLTASLVRHGVEPAPTRGDA